MASFSRGPMLLFMRPVPSASWTCTQCLRQAQRLRPSSANHLSLPRRALSMSRRLSQIQSRSPAQTSKSRLSRSRLSSPSEGTTDDLAPRLNMTLTGPTVIYEAPSHRTLKLAACGLALFFTGYGIFQALNPGMSFIFGTSPEKPEQRISWIIPPILVFAGGVFICIGVWTYGAARNLVRRITIIPHGEKGPMQALVEVSKLAPWTVHSFELPLSQLSLGRRMQDVAPSASTLEQRYASSDKAHALIRPFIRAGSWTRTFFDESRNVFWRASFVSLSAGSHGRYTLDARGSAYKGAVGLDRLIKQDIAKGKFYEALG